MAKKMISTRFESGLNSKIFHQETKVPTGKLWAQAIPNVSLPQENF